jgi:hypothetical protein
MDVVHDQARGLYCAFFCARRKAGRDAHRRGCIGVASSPDLRSWVMEPPILAPNLFPRLYAPHVVSERHQTLLFYTTPEEGLNGIRMATALRMEGPFERPEQDVLTYDARDTVHTVPLRTKRLVFFGRRPAGQETGSSLSRPGLLEFRSNGRPFVRFYDVLLTLTGRTLFQTEASLESGETLVRVLPRYATDFRLNARVRSGAKSAGILFRTTMTGHDNITIWMDYAGGAVLARRGTHGRLLARVRHPWVAEDEYRISIWVEGDFADVFVDDEWVMTAETGGRGSGGFGLAVVGGTATFREVTVQTIEKP